MHTVLFVILGSKFNVVAKAFTIFVQEFVKLNDWAHLDIAGVMEAHGEFPYLTKGMSGM